MFNKYIHKFLKLYVDCPTAKRMAGSYQPAGMHSALIGNTDQFFRVTSGVNTS